MSAETKKASIEIGSDIWDSIKSTGNWVGGALKGEFNDKATLGQIVCDAVISMFPIAGEATAVRDLIAVVNRMLSSKAEAEKVLNWVSIILCLLPIIPVVGGVVKGVGRLLITVIKDTTKANEIALAILAFLRKMGYGDPIKYIDQLKFSKYQATILSEFKKFITRFKASLNFFNQKMSAVLPQNIQTSLNAIGPKLDQLVRLADKMIPSAIKELDAALNKVRSEMINQMNQAGTKIGGGQTKVMTKEARLAASASKTIASKGHKPAPLSHYKHKEGWPDLSKIKDEMERTDILKFYVISSFSVKQKIIPKLYLPGTKVCWKRVISQKRPFKSGAYWADKMPDNGTAWRLDYAVKSRWSPNGAFVELDYIPTVKELKRLGIKVPDSWKGLKTWEGSVAEQHDLEKGVGSGLLLPGGGKQIYIDFSYPDNLPIREYIEKILKIKETHWRDAILSEDISSTVDYLLQREVSKKTAQQGRSVRGVSSSGRANTKESNERNSGIRR